MTNLNLKPASIDRIVFKVLKKNPLTASITLEIAYSNILPGDPARAVLASSRSSW